MNGNLLGQVLAGVFGNALQGRQSGGLGELGGGLGGGLGNAGLGAVLGGMLGRGRSPMGRGSALGGGGALIGMLLPLAMQWVQRNGGVGAVLNRVRQKGYSQQAASWVSTGPNEAIDSQAIGDVVGNDELSRLSQQLHVPQEEVASGFAEILPEVVNQLTPDGQLAPDANSVFDGGLAELQALMREQPLS
ncbi:MAG: YidB family protein [Ramlibacter sp.]|nr:YidB family protein [Ramlibacter sp.]